MTIRKAKPIAAVSTALAFAAAALIAAPGTAFAESRHDNHKRPGHYGKHDSRPHHGPSYGSHDRPSYGSSHHRPDYRPGYRPGHNSYNGSHNRPSYGSHHGSSHRPTPYQWNQRPHYSPGHNSHGYRPPAYRPSRPCYSRTHGHAYGRPHDSHGYRQSSRHDDHIGEVVGAVALTAAVFAILTH